MREVAKQAIKSGGWASWTNADWCWLMNTLPFSNYHTFTLSHFCTFTVLVLWNYHTITLCNNAWFWTLHNFAPCYDGSGNWIEKNVVKVWMGEKMGVSAGGSFLLLLLLLLACCLTCFRSDMGRVAPVQLTPENLPSLTMTAALPQEQGVRWWWWLGGESWNRKSGPVAHIHPTRWNRSKADLERGQQLCTS